MNFCTAINCMDGRVQIPVIVYLRERFKFVYGEVVSESGPNRVLADGHDELPPESIWARVEISTTKNDSQGIGVIGHYDWAGNPVEESDQHQCTAAAVRRVGK